jgi:hypothetical protein
LRPIASVHNANGIEVSFGMAESHQVTITARNRNAPYDSFATRVNPNGAGIGDYVFSGLHGNTTYDVSAHISDTTCGTWSEPVTLPLESVSYYSGVLWPDGGDGYATLTLSSSGDYTFSGHFHGSTYSTDYAFTATTNWRDANNVPFGVSATGQTQGTPQINPNRDSDWSWGGHDDRLATAYTAIKAQGGVFSLRLNTDVARVIADSLLDLSIVGALIVGGGACAHSGQWSVEPYKDSRGGSGVEAVCHAGF